MILIEDFKCYLESLSTKFYRCPNYLAVCCLILVKFNFLNFFLIASIFFVKCKNESFAFLFVQ